MDLFRRLFKIGQSEANSAVDKFENPVKMTEQGIRDLKEDLTASIEGLAEVKALEIRAKNNWTKAKNEAKSYENKAIIFVQKGDAGKMDSAEADRLATAALTKLTESKKQAVSYKKSYDTTKTNVNNLDIKVRKLRDTIDSWENELKTLKSRSKISNVTKKINKNLAGVDSNSTIAMLERMKENVDEDEATAEAYGNIADEKTSIDDEMDAALAASSDDDALAALKEKMKK